MRKLIIYILLIIVICFAIPMFFTKSFQTSNVSAEVEENMPQSSISNYNYKEFDTISLLHKKDNTIEEVKLDEYLYGVVSAEMPVDFELEALKAQAVVARTYTIYKIINSGGKHGEADICDDSTCCQAWISKEDRMNRWEEGKREENWKKIVNAVNSTQGKIITYNGEPINAFFHSNSGGKTEVPINVWGGSGYPYLQCVETSGEENYSQYASEAEFSKSELEEKIKSKYSDLVIDSLTEENIKILEYTDSGRVKILKVGNKNISGVEIRTLLGLRSTNFKVSFDSDKVKFEVIGYGHGVGLSQTGSDSLAKQGMNYEEIIKHFYSGVEIINY